MITFRNQRRERSSPGSGARRVASATGTLRGPFKATVQATRGRFDFMVGNVPLFSGPPLHVHTDQHDTFYVLDGILTLQVYDEIHELGPGDFVTVPLAFHTRLTTRTPISSVFTPSTS